jgi:hypothetical protein
MRSKAELITAGRAILDRAQTEQRKLTEAERDEVREIIAQAEVARSIEALGGSIGVGGGGSSFSAALLAAGFDRHSRPSVSVSWESALPPIGATSDLSFTGGDYDDAIPTRINAPGLGADQRFLFTSFPRVGLDAAATAVDSFRQSARTLPEPITDMVRDLTAVTEKPRMQTATELVHEPLHQVAVVESEIPNVMLDSRAIRGWIDNDLRFAWSMAVDTHALARIEAATPELGDPGSHVLAAILNAAAVVAGQGYSPSVLAASPEFLIDLLLAEQPGTQDFVGSFVNDVLSNLRRVAVPGLTTAYIIDPTAAGTLYSTLVQVAAFEENAGQTNTSTVRCESNALFVVQRAGAIVEVGGAS